ncbi:hemerythrin domain-containing protein [Sneathiella sp. HT1-7]|uniref:hemerythrin domain-containing protein n=1 Tax=Sneathiella sp. HT1-7 TaxID=2887192 RepID=UPI001D15A449|nr:hemerythrin domain-containing protein [Sneathiella sp. HT1-7]MCC3306295.1 hemerythrin domain-containing protein [Sneathiella sp. HT1-7]
MSQVIAKLQEDHRRMSVLLEVLEREVVTFSKGNSLNFFMVETILDYIVNFPQRCHHPIENFLLKSLTRRNPEAGAVGAEILDEHEELTNIITRFSNEVKRVKLEEPILREELLETVCEYKAILHQHMRKEETIFFPAAAKSLIQADWDVIETRMRDKGDPVFGREADREYRALHKVIVDWGQR